MKTRGMEATSAYTRRLPQGCKHCRRGTKLVLLVTGKCSSGCFYCPLSEKKQGQGQVYADELLAKSDEDVLLEARLIGAKGTGITGGDPLDVLDSVVHYIALLKGAFGPEHHIHLYTATIEGEAYRRLQVAGLDELRVHPSVRSWNKMESSGLKEAVEGLEMDVGLEVPSIPGEDGATETLIRFADRIGLDFVNLNELEFSETNCVQLKKKGFEAKDDASAAAKGSEALALKLLELDVKIPIHYCSSSFKDSVQLRNRLRRRAKNTARPGDVITDDGTLVKGVIEGTDLALAERILREEFQVPRKLIHVDEEKNRLEIAPWVLQELSTRLPFECYIVEEYPTADRLEVERERLEPEQAKSVKANKLKGI